MFSRGNFNIKNKLKSEVFNKKKKYLQYLLTKIFFSVITKNSK